MRLRLEGLLITQKDAPDCFAILSLIYSHLNFGNQDYHKDHLHPASYFYGIKRAYFQTDDDFNPSLLLRSIKWLRAIFLGTYNLFATIYFFRSLPGFIFNAWYICQ